MATDCNDCTYYYTCPYDEHIEKCLLEEDLKPNQICDDYLINKGEE